MSRNVVVGLMGLLQWMFWIIYSPCSPIGRKNRIRRLVDKTGELEEVCAAIVYMRDARRFPFSFSEKEKEDVSHICEMVKNNRLRLPLDRMCE